MCFFCHILNSLKRRTLCESCLCPLHPAQGLAQNRQQSSYAELIKVLKTLGLLELIGKLEGVSPQGGVCCIPLWLQSPRNLVDTHPNEPSLCRPASKDSHSISWE